MIKPDIFNKNESKLLHLTSLWNYAEANPNFYDKMFTSNPHELAAMIGNGTTFGDWQEFLSDARIQDYIDKVLYTQAGQIVARLLNQTHMSVSDSTRLNSAIKYRDDHKPDYAIPVQYIYIATPLTPAERAFLPTVDGRHDDDDVVV